MKRIWQNYGCLIVAVSIVLVLGIGIKASADTIDFNVTVNKSTTNEDPLSKKVTKSTDGDTYFYVTPSYFSSTGNIKVRSINKSTPSIRSSYYSVSSGSINVTNKHAYGVSAPGNVYYYMEADFQSGSASKLNVKGRYTP
jgi:hypothetical protein